jgi:hypothetical protein
MQHQKLKVYSLEQANTTLGSVKEDEFHDCLTDCLSLKKDSALLNCLNNNQNSNIKSEQTNNFWDELIAYFSLIHHGPHRKQCLQQFFLAARTSLPICYPETVVVTESPLSNESMRHTPVVLLLTHPHGCSVVSVV